MSYLTDDARAAYRSANRITSIDAPTLEDIIAENPDRRTILRRGLMLSALPALGPLAACDDNDGDVQMPTPEPSPTPSPTPTPTSYEVTFEAVAANQEDDVTVPAEYTAETIFKAGDPVIAGAPGYSGNFQSSDKTELQAGGNHDGMHYYEIEGVDPNTGGLLAINHELPDFNILFEGGRPDPQTATDEQKKIALSAVGVSVIEVAKADDGSWSVKTDSTYNKRYTGNTVYRVGGPAGGLVGSTVKGTLNNCSSGPTPWGTYLTCEETMDNYLDPTQPEEGYGWVVEIDPYGELAEPTKRTAMGRFNHENVAYMTDADNRVAFYMGDDTTPGCIYKFIPGRAFESDNRSANIDLLDYGTLYVARFNGDGSGDWLELSRGKNGLVMGATDPGNTSQGDTQPTTVDFPNQAAVLINAQSAARVAGGTVMDRPEWISVAPDKTVFVTLTNNSGREITDAANPRVENRHGHIIRWKEEGDSPLATGFTWDILLLAGDPSLDTPEDNLEGNIEGDTFSSPDGIRVDPQGRLWVETDHSIPGNSGVEGETIEDVFGHNAMFHIDRDTGESRRFLVGPEGCEITGIAYTPDLMNFFINIQHPTGNWPVDGQEPRSSTVVVRRTDEKPVGA
ncbi:PhoX family protein [Stakelama saccharophila]|uniref:PhoX family phosphatase n=1 Tax=Stakelama saccharophila TaxID=3075605 RepID=A0ABZ0B8V2_9SPHN|nr:PhoX family phosphatase [Stakelama sp. W311]WNO53288.1 PhoX family phosphatase [Stakelama sp. W311]